MNLNIVIVCMAVLAAALYQTRSSWWPSTNSHDGFWPTPDAPVHSEDFVAQHNLAGLTWEATSQSRFTGLSVRQARSHLGLHLSSGVQVRQQTQTCSDLPSSFNASAHWQDECPGIGMIQDQANCGSCWAVSVAEVLTDRYCIANIHNKPNPFGGTNRISAAHIMGCCAVVQGQKCTAHPGNGCAGGDPRLALMYFEENGGVTGGGYNQGGCQEYPYPHCSHHVDKNRAQYGDCSPLAEPSSTKCNTTCLHSTSARYQQEIDWLKPTKKKKTHQSSLVYRLPDVEDIKCDLFTHGPLSVSFDVYPDFLSYRAGVYKKSDQSGDLPSGHAVKLVGWGQDPVTQEHYWLAANQWNSDWGESGYFRITQNTEVNCRFQDNVYGYRAPLLSSPPRETLPSAEVETTA